MITTTTPSVEGKRIVEYKGIVFGEVVSGVNFVRDLAASFSNFFGGRSGSYEDELIQARQNALREMEQRAAALGANAVVGKEFHLVPNHLKQLFRMSCPDADQRLH